MSAKVLSLRSATREGNYAQKQVEMDQIKMNPLALLLMSFALIAEIYLIVKYLGIDPYAIWSVVLLSLGCGALLGVLWLTKGKVITSELPFIKGTWPALKYVFGMFSLVALIALIDFLLQMSFRYALETIDIYFYYLAAAVIEEAFFRLFLINVFIWVLSRKIGKIGAIVIGVLVSSIIFMLAHWSAYGTSPHLMMAMFFGGIAFSIYYLVFKDITITMLAHLLINFITVSTTIMVV